MTNHRWAAFVLGCLTLLTPAADTTLNSGKLMLPAPTRATAAEAIADQRTRVVPETSLTQHLVRLGVERWHSAGYRGRGIKVAVLDSGFRGYRDCLGKGLPKQVIARSFRNDGNLEARDSQHGILCGAVIHSLAPEAELLFANWEPDHPDHFLEAVRWARDQGARIISCSVIMPSWSDGEGGGGVHQRLAAILGDGRASGDVLCFASAGNTARRHWSGSFNGDREGWHQWQPGQVWNAVTPLGSEPVTVELYWPNGPRYALTVRDATTEVELKPTLLSYTSERSCAVVRFTPQAGHTYEARVRVAEGKPRPFHLVVLGGGLGYAESSGSVCFPADGAEVIAVGAVDEKERRLSYSSCGPNLSCLKPDLMAPVPFPCGCRTRPFGGTSAAAPQAAALAAVLWSRHRDWSSEHIRSTLQSTARDLGPVGPDPETGYGLVQLPR